MRLTILCFLLCLSNLQAVLVSEAPHSQFIPSHIQQDRIISANETYLEQITEKVLNFPLSNYEIHHVTNLGLFFLDAKSDWIKDILKRNMHWEGYILPIIKKYVKPNTLVLDVGAHIGTHTLNLARAVGPQGQVIAFEPQPKTFCELFMNTEINQATNVTCFWGALGDRSKEIELPQFHPEVEVTYLFDFSYGHSENFAPMIPLDSLNLNNISFMKVDVDGCDEIFLDGARETILRNRPVILMEICGGVDLKTASLKEKREISTIKQTIKDLGYKIKQVSVHDYLCIPLRHYPPAK